MLEDAQQAVEELMKDTGEYIWLMDEDTVKIDGIFSLSALQRLVEIMETAQEDIGK